jgi:hypothetical protein
MVLGLSDLLVSGGCVRKPGVTDHSLSIEADVDLSLSAVFV